MKSRREAYYVAKGWAEEERFGEQAESDGVLDDVCRGVVFR